MENINNCCREHKGVFLLCWIVFILLMVSLFVLSLVYIQNKIKEGKYIGQDVESRNTISVTETGEIYSKPDLAVISFSVVTEKKTVSEVMEENTEKMNKVIGTVKDQGVEDKDLKTTYFNLYPRYDYLKYSYPQGQRVLLGYEIRQTLEVKIRDLAKIGFIIEGATGAGANEVSGFILTIDNQDELKKQARAKAIEEAEVKARELVSDLGVKLGDIVSFAESSQVPYYRDVSFMSEGLGGGSPDIKTGENKIAITVTITYEIGN